MNQEAAKENLLTLQQLLGFDKDTAKKIIGSAILITGGDEYPILSNFIQIILEKTFERVDDSLVDGIEYSCEITLGNSTPRTTVPKVFVCQSPDSKNILISSIKTTNYLSKDLPQFLYFLSACYVGGLTLKAVSGTPGQVTQHEEVEIDIKKLIPDSRIFSEKIDFGEAYLAGAGAMGNAFLAALSTFDVTGEINIADPDRITGRNLNRCLFFSENDITKYKSEVLKERVQRALPNVTITPFNVLLNKVPAAKNGGPWLQRLIVGVDSRRARRRLQEEIPKEVFDASTTGITEVVVHHHKRPMATACLSCIYAKEKEEEAHEKHIAESLGVSIDEVKKQFIGDTAANKIIKLYPQFHLSDLIGIAYDTLFKQLCGEGNLHTSEDKQVLAPLAFVSSLAGALLALNFVQNTISATEYNYWRLSPWAAPNYKLQQVRPRNCNCEFCNDPVRTKIATKIWG